MEEKVQFSIKVTVDDMYKFLLRHLFSGFGGWFGILFAAGLLVLAFVTKGKVPVEYSAMYVVIAVFVLVYPFFNMRKKAKRQVGSDSLKSTLNYEADDQGFTVSRDEEQLSFKWQELKKVVETKGQLIVYVNTVRAFLWPKEQLGQKEIPLRMLLEKKLQPSQNGLKKTAK